MLSSASSLTKIRCQAGHSPNLQHPVLYLQATGPDEVTRADCSPIIVANDAVSYVTGQVILIVARMYAYDILIMFCSPAQP